MGIPLSVEYKNGVLDLTSQEAEKHTEIRPVQNFPLKGAVVTYIRSETSPSEERATPFSTEMNDETRIWLADELSGDLPPYHWGEAGLPSVKPLRYEPGVGFVIIEDEAEESAL